MIRLGWLAPGALVGGWLAGSACGSTPPAVIDPPAGVVATIEVSSAQDTLDALGATQQLSAVARDGLGDPVQGKTFSWSSSAPAVVSVDGAGLATAVGPGQSTVTASVDGVTGTALLVVEQVAASVDVTVERDTLAFIGDTVTLTAQAVDAGGSDILGVTPSWSISDAQVATVSSAGLVTALTNGETTVSASIDSEADSVAIVVRQVPTGLSLQIQPGSANSGDPLNPQPVIEVVDLAGTLVSEPSVATIDVVLASGGGTLTGNPSASVVAGVASFGGLAVEGSPGPRRLAFSAAGLGTVTSDEFTIGAIGQADEIVLVSGDNQSGPVNTVLPAALTVAVRDVVSNPVSGVTVNWAVTAGQASLGSPTSVTDVNGLAPATLTLGPVAEMVAVQASVQGLTGSPVQFTATTTAPPSGDTVYVETFTVPDGSAWPSPWEEIPQSGIVVADVQGGRARFAGGSGGTEERLARLRNLNIDEQDAELWMTVEFESLDDEGIGFYFRHNGGFLTATNPAGQGYAMFIEGGNSGDPRFGLWREINGVETRHAVQTVSIQSGVPYRVRYQVEQISPTETRQRGKVWALSDPEPTAWTIESITTFAVLQNISGGIILDMFNYRGSGHHVFVDDIVIARLNP